MKPATTKLLRGVDPHLWHQAKVAAMSNMVSLSD